MTDHKQQGKRNRQQGAEFERRVRQHLEDKGWIVTKWQNNLTLAYTYSPEKEVYAECVPAKSNRYRLTSTGFPDFICYREVNHYKSLFGIIFVECKINGYLTQEEKDKVKWYLNNGFCSRFLIAYKTKDKGRVKINLKEILE
jgi:hypothetical protein